MSGAERKPKPEIETTEQEPERERESPGRGVFGSGDSNADAATRAERVRATRLPEYKITLPDLGAPSHGVWEDSLSRAFRDGLRGFFRAVPAEGGGIEVLGDAGVRFASEAATSLLKSGYDELGGASGLLELAREYPVPAAVLLGAVGYGASVWLDGKPELKLKVKLSPISENLSATVSHDLKTHETGFLLKFKYEW